MACDKRNFSKPVFYLTNDSENGELRQYSSINEISNDTDKWSVILSSGKLKFLVLDLSKKMFYWSSSKEKGKLSTIDHSQNIEGIDFRDSNLYFVSKILEKLFILEPDNNKYEVESIISS